MSLAELITERKKLHTNKIVALKKSSPSQKEYTLSFPHQRLWYITQTFKNPIIFNNLITLSLQGALVIEKLEKAFRKLIERHEIFRTCLVIDRDKAYGKVANNVDFELERVDFSCEDSAVQQKKVEEWAQNIVSIPFDLSQPSFIKAHIIKLNHQHHVLVMSIHQFLIDGSSMDIFYGELSKFYNDDDYVMEPLLIQYKDYAVWQDNDLTEESLREQIDFWTHTLKGAPEQLKLRVDKVRPKEFSYNGRVYTTFLSPNTADSVTRFCKEQDVTLFMVLLSAYAILLFTHGLDDDIVVGSPIANRNHPELEGLIGFFVNLIPYRIKLNPSLTFVELALNVKNTALAAYSHQDLPFIHLPDYLHIKRSQSYHPVFQAVLAMQPYGVDNFKLDGINVQDLDYEEPIAKFDITLNASVKKQGIEIKFEYASDLFFQATIEKMASEYENILRQTTLNPGKPLNEIINPFRLKAAV